MSTISKDVIAFCGRRMDPIFANRIITSNQGLDGLTDVSAKLAAGDYIPILQAVWSERDRSRRLTWLRENASFHVPLLFELGMAEFAAKPDAATLSFVAIPLFEAADLILTYDAVPYVYSTEVLEEIKILYKKYSSFLQVLVEKKMGQPYQVVYETQNGMRQRYEVAKTIKETGKALLGKPSLPDPKWLQHSLPEKLKPLAPFWIYKILQHQVASAAAERSLEEHPSSALN